jgi:hypothetical protein
MEAARADSAILIHVRLVRIVGLVPALSRSAPRAPSAGSCFSVSNRGVLRVMPM